MKHQCKYRYRYIAYNMTNCKLFLKYMAIWIMGHDHVKTLKPKNFAEKVYFITFFSTFTDFTVKFKVHISLYNIYKAIHPIKIILGIWR